MESDSDNIHQLLKRAESVVNAYSDTVIGKADEIIFTDGVRYVLNYIVRMKEMARTSSKIARDYKKDIIIAPNLCPLDTEMHFKHSDRCYCKCGNGKVLPRRRLNVKLFTDDLRQKLIACSQKDEIWSKAREKLLTAANSALYAGYATPFSDTIIRYAIDKGIIMDPFVTNEAVTKGIVCEDLVVDFLNEKIKQVCDTPIEFARIGMNIPEDKLLRYIGASPDRIVNIELGNGKQRQLLLEVKVTSWKYKYIPLNYMCQLQLNMHLSNTRHAWFVMAKVSDTKPYVVNSIDIRIIQYSEKFANVLIDRMSLYAYCLLHDIVPVEQLYKRYPKLPVIDQSERLIIVFKNDKGAELYTKITDLFSRLFIVTVTKYAQHK
jgi:hypothetical protein